MSQNYLCNVNISCDGTRLVLCVLGLKSFGTRALWTTPLRLYTTIRHTIFSVLFPCFSWHFFFSFCSFVFVPLIWVFVYFYVKYNLMRCCERVCKHSGYVFRIVDIIEFTCGMRLLMSLRNEVYFRMDGLNGAFSVHVLLFVFADIFLVLITWLSQ